jgi:hypothetical protein
MVGELDGFPASYDLERVDEGIYVKDRLLSGGEVMQRL